MADWIGHCRIRMKSYWTPDLTVRVEAARAPLAVHRAAGMVMLRLPKGTHVKAIHVVLERVPALRNGKEEDEG